VPSWYIGIATGVEAGVDLARANPHRFAATIRYERAILSAIPSDALTLGLAYRHY
jgi:hypothetical protein